MKLNWLDTKKGLEKAGWKLVNPAPVQTVWLEGDAIVCWNGPDRRHIIEIDLTKAQVFSRHKVGNIETLIVREDHGLGYTYSGLLDATSLVTWHPEKPKLPGMLPDYLKVDVHPLINLLPDPT